MKQADIFSTRVNEHLSSDRSSHVFKHLQNSKSSRTSGTTDCFKVLDSAAAMQAFKLSKIADDLLLLLIVVDIKITVTVKEITVDFKFRVACFFFSTIFAAKH